jgi:hypothetical protein
MPRIPGDKHSNFEKPELCEKVLELLGITWTNEDSSEGGTCTKKAWGKVYDKLLELQAKGYNLRD